MKKGLLALALCAGLTAQAAEPFVGTYRDGSVDSVYKLMLLDKHRYCFFLMAGSLDLITGGTWQAKRKGNISTIRLKETWLDLPALMLVVNFNLSDPDWEAKIGQQRALLFSPYELDRGLKTSQIYYAFGSGNTFPKKDGYTLSQNADSEFAHIVIPDNAQYVFIRTGPDQPVYRFHIGNSQRALLVLNEQARRQPADFTLAYNHKTRILTDTQRAEEWGQPEKAAPVVQSTAWRQCQPKAPKTVRRVNGSERSVVIPDIFPDK